ncbi:hypothetical protein TcBrA4_0108610 [Trypanosoma cruzi]|nr:hypothetical protein TcBrA4_0108610 [Trypanosoma cruzi]
MFDEDWQKTERNAWPVLIQKGITAPNHSEGSCSMTSGSEKVKNFVFHPVAADPSSVERDPRAALHPPEVAMQACGNNKEGQPPLFLGPGPSTKIRYDKLFCCFNEGMAFCPSCGRNTPPRGLTTTIRWNTPCTSPSVLGG